MTITCPTLPSSQAPLLLRILAAHRYAPAVRRIAALALLHELMRLGSPTQATLRSWAQIGCLLAACTIDLDLAGDERAVYFTGLARQAHDLWESALSEIEVRPPRWRRPRVIETTCTEVA
jgi:hypothetical protein